MQPRGCESNRVGAWVQEHSVLFVDDEVNILNALQRLLRNEPIQVLTATRPAEAFELIDHHLPEVVISDQCMPEMSGVDFLASVRDRHNDIVRMMMTGLTDMTIAAEAINRGEIYRLITKPWDDADLKATLRHAFDHHELKSEIKRLNQITREQSFKFQDMNKNLEESVRDRTKQLDAKNRELRTAYIETIRALAEAIDAKDTYTRGHSERVAVYSSRISHQMGLQTELIERIYFAGLLHDVGKIGIPDAIITKPGRLDPKEYESMQRHPEIGARILEPVEFLRSIVPCVRHHHEWFDGSRSGYPDRLAGDHIPLPSRVIVVADTVEAMTSDRPYRKGLPLDAVVSELHKFSGTQFDPVVIDAFLKLLEGEGDSFISKNQKFDIYEFIEG
jgi:response regulator RpfG family c-di-GMP phosphodiesterase